MVYTFHIITEIKEAYCRKGKHRLFYLPFKKRIIDSGYYFLSFFLFLKSPLFQAWMKSLQASGLKIFWGLV